MKRSVAAFCMILLLMTSVFATSPEETDRQVEGYVALTFDDGPSGALTEKLLDGLRQRNARATFFLCGYRIAQYPELMDRYLREGHEVGVHSTVHTDLTKITAEEVHRDMKETAQAIFITTGVRPTLMRPPGGAYDPQVLAEAQAEGLGVILWSVDPEDWRKHTASAVLSAMGSGVTHGDIVLLHDLSQSSVDAALGLIDSLQAKGYEFVTVSELATLSGLEIREGRVYNDFRNCQ